ncbi:gamma-glutamyl hydrolase-like [Dendronephthya gigantea]|uniref:gamma-glutamyl hydrolase-like n=1 Tax=Dendronephthya gigantea TaxID=151771 RepID=UPI00106CCED1|nr:gamma-glutamyl hydrolase-like [Dendronephthya gigantea]
MRLILISVALSLFLIPFHGSGAHREIQTDRPIIGVMAQATKRMTFEVLGKNYIPASYVKFLESSGARVVPIFNDLTENETKEIFQLINGVVFPGGIVNLLTSGYANVSRRIFHLAKKRNDEGGYFPIMGMCLGHQFLAAVVNNNTDNRILTDSYNMTAPLNLPKNFRNSKLFRDIPKDRVKSFNESLITPHFHNLSLPLRLFEESKELKDFYNVITTNLDRHGVEFVSTMEAKNYPFYSMQWHPEKCSFEWVSMKAIPHFLSSIQLSQYISNFFVQEARLNRNRFPSDTEERAALIYNYNPVYIGRNGNTTFSQIYLFN